MLNALHLVYAPCLHLFLFWDTPCSTSRHSIVFRERLYLSRRQPFVARPTNTPTDPPMRCTICMGDVCVSSEHTLLCGHSFCRSCLVTWFVGKGAVTCPLCRNVVDDAAVRALLEDRPFTRAMRGRVEDDYQTWRCRRILNMVRDRVLPLDIFFMATSLLHGIFEDHPRVKTNVASEYIQIFYG